MRSKRLLSIALCLILALSLMPTAAFAESDMTHIDFCLGYDEDGDTVEDTFCQQVHIGSTAAIPVEGMDYASRPGYRFDGWYTDESYTEAFDFSKVCTESDPVSCYAKWVKDAPNAITYVELALEWPVVGDTVMLFGDTPTNTPNVIAPEDAAYTVDSTAWIKGTYSEYGDGYDDYFIGTFEEDTAYYAMISISAKDGFTLASDVSITVNGEAPAEVFPVDSNQNISFIAKMMPISMSAYIMPVFDYEQMVSVGRGDFETPHYVLMGENDSFTPVTGEVTYYQVGENVYHTEDELKAFLAAQEAGAVITCDFAFQGSGEYASFTDFDTLTFTMVADVDTVDITIDEPVIGTALAENGTVTGSAAGVQVNDNCLPIESITWSPSDTTAVIDTVYTVTVVIKADRGVRFADTVCATVNGADADSSVSDGGALTVTYTFPKTVAAEMRCVYFGGKLVEFPAGTVTYWYYNEADGTTAPCSEEQANIVLDATDTNTSYERLDITLKNVHIRANNTDGGYYDYEQCGLYYSSVLYLYVYGDCEIAGAEYGLFTSGTTRIYGMNSDAKLTITADSSMAGSGNTIYKAEALHAYDRVHIYTWSDSDFSVIARSDTNNTRNNVGVSLHGVNNAIITSPHFDGSNPTVHTADEEGNYHLGNVSEYQYVEFKAGAPEHIDTVNIVGATLSFHAGDAPKFTAQVAPEDAGKYEVDWEEWCLLDENGWVVKRCSSDEEYNPEGEELLTSFEAGKTYLYSISVLITDSSEFAQEVTLVLNGERIPITDDNGFVGYYYLGCYEIKSMTPVEHTHNPTLVPAKDASCTEAGNKAYYTCDGCDKWFEDAAGAVEITDKSSMIVPATGHTASDWISDADSHWKVCTAADCGVVLEESKAAHSYGDDNVCDICGYEKAASSADPAKPDETTKPTGPQTGDSSYSGLWLAVLVVSGLGIFGITVYSKRKKRAA